MSNPGGNMSELGEKILFTCIVGIFLVGLFVFANRMLNSSIMRLSHTNTSIEQIQEEPKG